MSRRNIIFIAVGVLIILSVGFWYWQNNKSTPAITPPASTAPTPAAAATSTSLGTQVFEKSQNPINGKLPETNPFKAQTNPFTGVETNPLKAGTVNPFP